MEWTNRRAGAAWLNRSRLVRLPNKMSEVCKTETRRKEEQCIFDLVSTLVRKQAGSCEVINHKTVYCGAASCTVHFIPLESNLLD